MIRSNFVAFAALIICICAIWAMVSKHYRDGLIGKIILFFMTISAFAVFTKAHSGLRVDGVSESTLLCSLAAYWVRHIWVVLVWHPSVREYFKRHPHRDRRKYDRRVKK